MGIFKKEKKKQTDFELIEEWTPKLREFADKHNADIRKIEIDKYRGYDEPPTINVSIAIIQNKA